jgi:hypothetical protein
MPERVQKEVLSTDQRKFINVTLRRAWMANFFARFTRLLFNMKAQAQYNAAPRRATHLHDKSAAILQHKRPEYRQRSRNR